MPSTRPGPSLGAGESRAVRILLVHRDWRAVSSIAGALRDSGFEVSTASDGAHALESAQQLRFDLLVLSDTIDDLDPNQVCRALRSIDAHRPIMALVAGGREQVIAALEAGAAVSLAEPISTDEFLARVRALVRRYPPA